MTSATRFLDSMPPKVAVAYQAYPTKPRKRLLQLRQLLFKTAAQQDGVAELEECLRWGEPSYLTSTCGSGSMLRLHWRASTPEQVGLFVHCQTRLISEFRARYPELEYEGKRALLIPIAGRLPTTAIADCMALALTYRRR